MPRPAIIARGQAGSFALTPVPSFSVATHEAPAVFEGNYQRDGLYAGAVALSRASRLSHDFDRADRSPSFLVVAASQETPAAAVACLCDMLGLPANKSADLMLSDAASWRREPIAQRLMALQSWLTVQIFAEIEIQNTPVSAGPRPMQTVGTND